MHRAKKLSAACLLALVCLVGIPAVAAEATTIDLNTATTAQLIELPGVGQTIAQRVVDFREENGPFRRIEDLMKVKGIGEKSFEKLRPYLRVGKSK